MKRIYLTALVAFAMIVAACGGDSDADDTADAEATTATTVAAAEPTNADDGGGNSTTEDVPASDANATTTTVAATVDEDASDDTADGGDDAGGGATLAAAILPSTDTEVLPGRFEATFTIVPADSGAGLGEVEMQIEGAFDPATESARILMDLGSLMAQAPADELEDIPPEMLAIFEEPMEIITVGDTSYMKWGFLNVFLGADGWVELPADETGAVTSEFGFGGNTGSPADLLDQLRDAEAEVEELGRESIRGVETTHYRALLDLEKLAENLPPEERAELEGQFGTEGINEFPIELWVSDEGLVHRYLMEIDATSLPDNEDVDSMTMLFEMFDYGVPVEILPPDPSEVTPIDELAGGFGIGG